MKASYLLRPAPSKAILKLPIVGAYFVEGTRPGRYFARPNNNFDPGDITRLMDPMTLKSRMPTLIKDLARRMPYAGSNNQAKWAYGEICDVACRVLKVGPEMIKGTLYYLFAAAENIETVRTPLKFIEGNVIHVNIQTNIKPLDKLTDSERTKWETHQFTRNDAVIVLERFLGIFCGLPDTRYIDDRGVQELKEKVWNLQYAIALDVLPDITDAEAKTLFGQLSSTNEVREKAKGHIRT